MIHLFYDRTTGRPLYTTAGGVPPVGEHFLVIPSIPTDLNAYRVVDGALVLHDLTPVKDRLQADLLAKVAELRKPFVTTLPGQEMIYLRKEEEAARFLADPAPVMAEYLLLSAEVGITAPTAYELAQLWLNMSVLWRRAAAPLEQYRLKMAAQIDAATTLAELDLLREQINPTEPEPEKEPEPEPEKEPEPEPPVENDALEPLRYKAFDRLDQSLDQVLASYVANLDHLIPSWEDYQAALSEFAVSDDPAALAIISRYEIHDLQAEEFRGIHQDAVTAVQNATTPDEIFDAVEIAEQEWQAIQ